MEEIIILYSNEFGIGFIILGIIMIVCGIPLKKGLIKRNWLYGFRIKKSFEYDEYWYKINKYGGERIILWSLPIFILAFVNFLIPLYENFLFYIIFNIIALHVLIIIPILETIRYAKKL